MSVLRISPDSFYDQINEDHMNEQNFFLDINEPPFYQDEARIAPGKA